MYSSKRKQILLHEIRSIGNITLLNGHIFYIVLCFFHIYVDIICYPNTWLEEK